MMAFVRRANVILEVPDDYVDDYYNKGYDVVDEKTGEVLKKAIPTDIGMLQTYYLEHTKKISELEAEIKHLKQQAKKKQEKENT